MASLKDPFSTHVPAVHNVNKKVPADVVSPSDIKAITTGLVSAVKEPIGGTPPSAKQPKPVAAAKATKFVTK